jgi:hypothetical protein
MSKVYISTVKAEFNQEKDGEDQNHQWQELTLEITHCGAGPYLVIRTERWAMDHVSELTNLLEQFKQHVEPLFERNEE